MSQGSCGATLSATIHSVSHAVTESALQRDHRTQRAVKVKSRRRAKDALQAGPGPSVRLRGRVISRREPKTTNPPSSPQNSRSCGSRGKPPRSQNH